MKKYQKSHRNRWDFYHFELFAEHLCYFFVEVVDFLFDALAALVSLEADDLDVAAEFLRRLCDVSGDLHAVVLDVCLFRQAVCLIELAELACRHLFDDSVGLRCVLRVVLDLFLDDSRFFSYDRCGNGCGIEILCRICAELERDVLCEFSKAFVLYANVVSVEFYDNARYTVAVNVCARDAFNDNEAANGKVLADREDLASYQSASGAGAVAMEELKQQYKDIVETGSTSHISKFPFQLAYNVIPQIDKMMENDYTKEEMKMYNETRKIMHSDVRTSATCVRVSSLRSHSESVWFQTERPLSVEEIREALRKAPGVTLKDDPQNYVYPMPLESAGQDDVFVGRVRKDIADDNGSTLWLTGDQIRKGAALNAVQIAELL